MFKQQNIWLSINQMNLTKQDVLTMNMSFKMNTECSKTIA